jgi:hypothetical protein
MTARDATGTTFCWLATLFSRSLSKVQRDFNKSDNWFGKKKRERRDDPLLCYLHYARNADEHGVPSVTELDRQKIVFVEGDKPIAAIEEMVGNVGRFRHVADEPPDLKNVTEMRVYPDRARLIPVKDRGKVYDQPNEHLGSAIEDNAPIFVAQLMVQYIEQMIAEAESLSEGSVQGLSVR